MTDRFASDTADLIEELREELRTHLDENLIGATAQKQIARWNELPLEVRVRYASLLLRRELHVEQFSDVRFAVEGGDGLDPNMTITVSLLPVIAIDVVHVNFTIDDKGECRFESREDPPGSGNHVAWCQTHLRVHSDNTGGVRG